MIRWSSSSHYAKMKPNVAIIFLAVSLPTIYAEFFGAGSKALMEIADVRLVGLDDNTGWYHRAQGLVIISDLHNHTAKLCSDKITDDEVRMICYRLGYSHGIQRTIDVPNIYNQYAEIPTMSSLACNGNERTLEECESDLRMWGCGPDYKNVELLCTNSWYGPGIQCGKDVGVETVAPNNPVSGKQYVAIEMRELDGSSSRTLETSRELQKRMVNPSSIQSAAQFPWAAKLKFWNHVENKWEHKCGAAIVTDRIVLTLAQCVDDIGYYSVKIGEFDTKVSNRFVETFEVLNTYEHPGFFRDPVNNDIAIVVLKDKGGLGIQFRPTALPVCLPKASVVLGGRKRAVIAGWGEQVEDKARVSRFLSVADVKLFSKSECKGHEDKSSAIICAGNAKGGSDACFFDLGAPLVTKINDRSLLTGILREPGCGVKGKQSKYVSVQFHLPWLTVKINEIHQQLRPVQNEAEEEDESSEEIDWSNDDWK